MQTSKCPKCGTTQEYHGTCRVNSDGSEVKMTVWHCGSRQIVEATGEVDWRDGAECKGLAFKAYTHERIDKLGAPHTVEDSEHTKAGCRIGGRFDWVEAELTRLKSEKEAAERERERNEQIINQLCDIFDCDGDEVTSKVELMAERFDEETAQLTAATSRAEALKEERDEAVRECERLKGVIVQAWKECDDARMSEVDEARIEAEHWKSEGDMYGWNFHQGRAAGMVTASIIYHRVELAALLQPAKEVEGG